MHVLKDIKLQICAKICLFAENSEMCKERLFANFGLDFEGQYFVDYSKKCCECQFGTFEYKFYKEIVESLWAKFGKKLVSKGWVQALSQTRRFSG